MRAMADHPASESRRRPLQLRLLGIGAIGLLTAALGLLLPRISPVPSGNSMDEITLVIAVSLVWLAVGLVAWYRRPANNTGRLMIGVFFAGFIWELAYVVHPVAWTISEAFRDLGPAITAHLLIAFPTGRLERRPERWAVVLIYCYAVAANVLDLFLWEPGPFEGSDITPVNLLFVGRNDELRGALNTFFSGGVPVIALVVVLLVALHWRRATPAGRRALTPVVLLAPLFYVFNAVAYPAEGFEWAWLTELLDSPGAWAIAYLRDLILPLGLLYGFVRLDLARASAARLAVDLGRGVPIGSLRDQIAGALRDPSLQIAFASPSGEGYVDSSGQPVDLPPADSPSRKVTRLEGDGELLAVLIHDRAADAEDPGLAEAVGSVARLSLANERLSAQVRAQLDEVRASRARIVEAADAERRRVERDLHDGAQQRLVALAMRLELARETAVGATELINETTAELQSAISEVRSLARGIHPTILTETGLRAAVEALAERTPTPVVIDIPDRRYPSAVEATAYYIVAEALTNVARYAGAKSVTVTARDDGIQLHVSVRDDGRGGADPARGSGLRGLLDRVAAAGGSLTVESPSGAGTLVRASLPVT
jgi:signal transduction histidine kinase